MTNLTLDQAAAEGEQLMTELLDATKLQQRVDGTYRTPHGSERETQLRLTEQWAGRQVIANTIAGAEYGEITTNRSYDEETPKLDEARGEIHYVSPGFGGYIALTNGTFISLAIRDDLPPADVEREQVGLQLLVI